MHVAPCSTPVRWVMSERTPGTFHGRFAPREAFFIILSSVCQEQAASASRRGISRSVTEAHLNMAYQCIQRHTDTTCLIRVHVSICCEPPFLHSLRKVFYDPPTYTHFLSALVLPTWANCSPSVSLMSTAVNSGNLHEHQRRPRFRSKR